MRKPRLFFLFCALTLSSFLHSQNQTPSQSDYASYFAEAYSLNPEIPRGMLEAVAWTNTRMRHVRPEQENASCMGLPAFYGVMGLVGEGQGHFRENLYEIARLAQASPRDLMESPRTQILAYATALKKLGQQRAIAVSQPEAFLPVLEELSGIPGGQGTWENFALNSELFAVLRWMNDPVMQHQYHLPSWNIDLEAVFGTENYQVLSASRVNMSQSQVRTGQGQQWTSIPSRIFSADYPPALWDPAPSCNWSTRGPNAVSAVTIHTIQGSYAGAISWFKNCNSNVSAHYVIRASDGQVTQMVLEADKAWHVGTENPYTIGLEHEGYVSDPAWYTTEMYISSSDVVKDIISSGYGIDGLKTYFGPPTNGILTLGLNCTKIKGHQHYPNQTHVDPGPNWDWDRYYNLVNGAVQSTTLTGCSGNFYDTGGANGAYGDQERTAWVIAPTGATSATLTFSSFDLESGYDYLYVYDGTDVNGEFLGKFDGNTAPGPFTANSGKFFLEFRSDCASTGAGWAATWTCSTAPLACGTPTGVSSSSVHGLGADVSWNAVAGATSYEVRVRNSLVPTWEVFSVNGTSLTLTGLKANALHYWQVRALCGTGTSSWIGGEFLTPQVSDHTVTACSGTFRDSGGDIGSYLDREDYKFTIAPPGSGSITLNFSAFNVEANFDFLKIYDGPSTASPLLGSYTGTNSPGTLTSSGGALTLHFTSDAATIASGWEATWQCITNQAPVTSISPLNDWYADNFVANFTDTDNSGQGLQQRFYQVLEYDGQQWGANRDNGFVFETFNDSFPNWTQANGNAYILNNRLHQTDTASTNTNNYLDVQQGSSHKWLYTFSARLWTSVPTTSRRMGLHIFADNPSATNRGNSYLVWIRGDNQTVEIYETVNNALNRMVISPMVVGEFVWNEYKVAYDPATGKIDVFQESNLVATWTDPSPIQAGSHVSLRTNQAHCDFENLRVFKSRGTSATILVGPAITDDCRYESIDPNTHAGQVHTLIRDNADNWSNLDFRSFKVDWTPPADVSVYDGPTTDIDTTFSQTELTGNWTASTDNLSGVVEYWYAWGSTVGGDDVVSWTSNGLGQTVNDLNLNLQHNQRYYLSVKAENGAGLFSNITNSDGQLVWRPGVAVTEAEPLRLQLWPNPNNGRFSVRLESGGATWAYELLNLDGKQLQAEKGIDKQEITLELEGLARGMYLLRIQCGEKSQVEKVIIR